MYNRTLASAYTVVRHQSMRLVQLVMVSLGGLAAVQAIAAFELLVWSLPLFGDPPMLQNGANRFANQLSELSQEYPDDFRRIPDAGRTFLWTFNRHMEGVELTLIAGLCFALSAVANLVLMALLWPASRTKVASGS